jgi:hypothetical protein
MEAATGRPYGEMAGGEKAEPAVREVTVADVERIDSLTLEDFAADFDQIELPLGPMSEEDLHAAVDRFLQVLREG